MIASNARLVAPGIPTQKQGQTSFVTAQTSATQDVFGSWVELQSSLNFKTKYLIVFAASAELVKISMHIGTGGAGSEVVQIGNIPVRDSAGENGHTYTIPYELASGARMAAQVVNRTNNTQASVTIQVALVG